MVALTDFTVAFEMATTSTPKTSSPSYTALTTYVMAGEGITLSRGRQSEQDASAQPGRASVKLRNTDNRFTMGNGSSPYAPLQLRRPCRFRVTYSATTYDLWQGFVDDWGNGRDELTGVARLSLSDRAARAAKNELKGLVDSEILLDTPHSFYPLDEPASADVAADRSGTTRPSLIPTDSATGDASPSAQSFGAGTVGGDQQTMSAFTPDYAGPFPVGRSLATGAGTDVVATALTLEAVVFLSEVPASGSPTAILVSGAEGAALYFNSAGEIVASINGGPTVTDAGRNRVGSQSHYALTYTIAAGTGTLRLYVNGAEVASGSAADLTITLGSLVYIGGGASASALLSGRVSHAAFYTSALSAGRVAAHADAAIMPAGGDLTSSRFSRLCAVAGLPSAFYTTTGTTETPMGPQPTAGKSLLDAINECAKAEGGVAYVSDTGVLTLATSRTRYNTAVGVTLDATKAGQVDPATEIPTTDQDLINDSSATRYGGPTFRTTDATSVDAYDLHDESETLFLALDAHALNWTQWRVAQFDTPAPRLNEVPVNVVGYANSGGNVANLLNAEIGTKLRVSNLPADVSATATLDLMVEGIRDDIRKNEWVRTFTTSPIGLNDTVWILDTDLLGVGTILGY